MKYLLICIFFLFTNAVYSQLSVTVKWDPVYATDANDSIYYNMDKKLDWKDFKGIPDQRSIAAAITASGFGYTMSIQTRNNKTNIVISVFCFFNKSTSWVKRGMKTDYALLHEQHHFDITYFSACQFVKKLKTAIFTRDNYDALIEKLNNETYAELEKMQDDYDGQTKNGQLKDVQAEWNEKIDKLLASIVIR